jgi:hypothetical protein
MILISSFHPFILVIIRIEVTSDIGQILFSRPG